MSATRLRHSRPNRVWRHTWRITAGLLAIIAIVLLACSFDEELLDTGALRYEPRQIPDAENAYLVLAKAAERLEKVEPHEVYRWSVAIEGTDWDEGEVAENLRDRGFALEAVRRLRDFHAAQAPIPHDAESAYALLPRIDLPMRLALLEARHLQRAQDHATATALVRDCIHAARVLSDGRGGPLFHHYTLGMHVATLEAIIAISSDPSTSAQGNHALLNEITSTRPTTDSFHQLIAAEYHSEKLVVDALHDPAKMPASWSSKDDRYLAYRVPFLFKPNQTLNYSIPYLLTMRGAVDLSLPERKKTIPHNADLLGFLCDYHDDWINRLGKQHAHNNGISSVSRLLDKRLDHQTRISLVETLIALRLYHDAHGRALPATLDELVPAYLPAVPRDYFDGRPVKYSRELRAVWSAGPEGNFQLTDADQAIHERELILPLCFDGSYAPWPRRDPKIAFFAGESDADSSPSPDPH